MRTLLFITFVFSLLFSSAQRLPAPIIETPDQPATEQSKPKIRHRTKSSSESSQTKTRTTKSSVPAADLQGPARFAGVWSGNIKQGFVGHVTATFTVSPDATSVQASQNMGGGTHPATMAGNTISWSTGTLGATASLTPNSDGQTAQLLLKGLLASSTATLRRGSIPATTATTAATTQATPAPLAPSNADTQGYGTVPLTPSGSMSGPKPECPPEARGQHLSGHGIFLMHFDKPTGNIIDVTVSQSTGSTILDQAAITTLRQWHATPGCPREVPMTVTFAVSGP